MPALSATPVDNAEEWIVGDGESIQQRGRRTCLIVYDEREECALGLHKKRIISWLLVRRQQSHGADDAAAFIRASLGETLEE